MALDELLAKTTIAFPRGVREKELKELFKFIVKTLPKTEITYYLNKSVHVGNRFVNMTEKVPVRASNNRITGHADNTFDCAGFECFKKDMLDSGPGFYGIRFSTTPGNELSEIPSSRMELMESVRTAVEKYFSANPKPI